jgi:hypothetical protein
LQHEVIGTAIALVNAENNIRTTKKAINAAQMGDPTQALIYSRQDKFSDVLRQTNYNNGLGNRMSYIGAELLDMTETFCAVVSLTDLGINISKWASKKLLNINKVDDTLSFGGFKDSIKKTYSDFTVNIKDTVKGLSGSTGNVTVNRLEDALIEGNDVIPVVDEISPVLNSVDDIGIKGGSGSTIITDEIKQDSEYMVKVSFPSIHKVYIENEFEDYYQVVGSCFVKEQTGLIKEKMYDITIRQKDKKEFEVLGFDIKN